MKYFILIFTFGLFISCSSSDSNHPPTAPDDKTGGEVVDPAEPTKDLQGLETGELIATKYDLLQLECSLWTQEGEIFVEGENPDDTLVWDFLQNLDDKGEFELIAKKPRHYFKMLLQFSPLEIVNHLNLQEQDGRIYKLQFTPVTDLQYYYESQITFSEFPAPVDRGDGLQNFNEKLAEKVVNFNKFSSVDPNHRFFERVTCLLHSEIKAQYQDQFRIEVPN
ncbi:MAG: hypothetical protein KDD33_00695 [Bdellovibrionales bacterium]|nr:hypothetical protein [Bdellovibrionales bacterium]